MVIRINLEILEIMKRIDSLKQWLDTPMVMPMVTLLLTFTLVTILCYKFRRDYIFWRKQGVHGDWAIPYLGAIWVLLTKDRLKMEVDLVRRFGRLHVQPALDNRPVLSIADPEILRQILVKDFDVFTDHMHVMHPWTNRYQDNFLIWLRGNEWRRVRSIMSPTFTSGKIKKMFKIFMVSSEELLSNIHNKVSTKGQVLDAMETYAMYTMDGITTCGCGIKLKQESEFAQGNNIISSRKEMIKHLSSVAIIEPLRLVIPTLVPDFVLRWFNFSIVPEKLYSGLVKRVEDIVRRRADDKNSKADDLLQMIVDANSSDDIEVDQFDSAENHHANLTQESIVKVQEQMVNRITETKMEQKLSMLEVVSGAIFMLIAGMDSTRTLMTNLSYSVAFHQEVQERLYQELLKIVEFEPDDKTKHKFSYEALTSCNYLDAAIAEALRILPPAIKTDRYTSRDYYIEKYNVFVPKGTQVFAAIHAVQNDPEYWDEPRKFNPERFLPENRDKIIQGSYLPFSMGPRFCIGMRFSLTEAKVAMAKIMMKYRFEPVDGTKYPPDTVANIVLNPLADPRIKFIPRQ